MDCLTPEYFFKETLTICTQMDEFDSSEYFSFPILEPIPPSSLNSPTPPLDLSQLPPPEDNFFLPDLLPSHPVSYPPLPPDSPCLVFPHPHPRSPYPPPDHDPPSPHTLSVTTMEELTTLSPTHTMLDDHHHSVLVDNHSHHQDILSSALVLNDITYQGEYSWDNNYTAAAISEQGMEDFSWR